MKMKKIVLISVSALAVIAAVLIYLGMKMPGEGRLSALPALTAEQQAMSRRLRVHVDKLAGEIGARHGQAPEAYAAAGDYIESAFRQAGLQPDFEPFGDKRQYRNVVAALDGADSAAGIIVVGAHYDTVPQTPGADDNASGVAVLLELARLLGARPLNRGLRFVAFANEEPPHFLTKDMGSLYHARRSAERGDVIRLMISLEMLGYYSSAPGSQGYPPPFSYFYPDRANFVAFVGNFRSRHVLKRALGLFRETKQFPSEGLAAPVVLAPDVGRSDQSAFWLNGFRAFMVTDTADHRNHAYHSANDVPASLDYDAMARVTTGLAGMLARLANEEPGKGL